MVSMVMDKDSSKGPALLLCHQGTPHGLLQELAGLETILTKVRNYQALLLAPRRGTA